MNRATSKNLPRITFGMIVLNGEPFVRYNLRALYPYAHQIIVVEGACVAAQSLASADGHSTDGTLEMLRQFKAAEDPQNKLVIVTAEDEGKPSGFWSEKDEMSQAYARRATGDWLWQVDYDEFYLERDIETVADMLRSDPEMAGISFPFVQFWGGFDYLEVGEYRYLQPCVHRVFRWREGYRYVSHRPPTVVDESGRDLRATRRWVHYRRMKRAGIYMYHYSCILPKQARQRVGYYAHVTWSDSLRNIEHWLNERFLKLGDPYHVAEGPGYWMWLKRYDGEQPRQIVRMRDDISSGRLHLLLRPTKDIEDLLASPSYLLGRLILGILARARWHLWRRPINALVRMARRVLRRLGLGRLRVKLGFLRKVGFRYRGILGVLKIPGWCSAPELAALHDLARGLPQDHPVVVEIGSFLGQSSLAMAKGLRAKSGPVLYCIDPFSGDSSQTSKVRIQRFADLHGISLRDLKGLFIENMKTNNVFDMIRMLVGYSGDFASGFAGKIDLLFIDGNHDYQAVSKDYRDWTPLVEVGGIVAFHDVTFKPAGDDSPGPGMVVKEHVLGKPEWSVMKQVDSLLVARKLR